MATLYKPTGEIETPRAPRAVMIGPTDPCEFTTIPAGEIESYLKQLAAPTINRITVNEVKSTYYPNIARYFGGYISGLKANELPPPPITQKVDKEVSKGGMSRKEFLKAQKDGKIVLQQYYIRTAEGTKHPGISSPIGRSLGKSVYYSGSVRDPSRWVSNPCLTYDSTPFGDRQIAEAGESVLTIRPRLTMHFADNVTWAYSTLDTAYIVDRLDSHFKTLSPNTGLVTSAIAEANDGDFDLLTNLGELPETVGWIMSTIKDIITLWRQARRDLSKIGSSGAKAAHLVAQRWMEFRYAIMPLVYSVNDGLDLLKASYVEYETIRKGINHAPIDLGDDIIFPEVRERVFLKQRIFAEIDRVNAGLKMNIFSTAWELVPLSFVVDWVFNIGDVLSSIGTPSHVKQRAMQVSFQVRDKTIDITDHELPGALTSVSYSAYRVQLINPQSHLGFSFNPSMSWKRWADALALSWLIFRNKS